MCFWREVDGEPFFLGIGGWAFRVWHYIIPLGQGCIWRLSALGSFDGFALCPDTALSNRLVGDRSVAGSACHTPHTVVLREAGFYFDTVAVCYTSLNSIADLSAWVGIARYRQDTAFWAQAYRLSTGLQQTGTHRVARRSLGVIHPEHITHERGLVL